MNRFFSIILVIVFSTQLLFAESVNKDLPKKFLGTFENYTQAAINRDFRELYEMRMPHFKFLFDYEQFSNFEKGTYPLKDVKITKIKAQNQEKIEIVIGLVLKNKKNMVYYDQIWYLIDGAYYLQQEDILHFRH